MSKQAHTVTANPAGHFDVLSGNSGRTYEVLPSVTGHWAMCECEGSRRRGTCSHIEAVLVFAAEALKAQAFSAAMVQARDESVFSRIERSERDPYETHLTPWPAKKVELL